MPEVTVSDPKFWKRRLSTIHRKDWIYQAVWHSTVEEWAETLKIHGEILEKLMSDYPEYSRILDAGCGQGHLVEILPKNRIVYYEGIDISPDFIQIAKENHPDHIFNVGDLRNLPFETRSFDFAIARSVEGMVCDGLGHAVWKEIEDELLRVAEVVVLLNYTFPKVYRLTSLGSIEESELFVPGYLERTSCP